MENTDSKVQDAAVDTAIRAGIDRSVRWPVLFFFTSGAFWLLAALAVGFLANYRLAWPGGPGSWAFLSFPRLQPAHEAMLLYGWGFNMGFGFMFWLMARLCRRELGGPLNTVFAGTVWNIGITIGVLGILAGIGSGASWLEFPVWIWPVLFIAYAVLAGKLFVLFLRRSVEHTFISVWYMVAALFAFPWLLMTALVLGILAPGSPVMSTAILHWFSSGMLHLFFIPVGLAALYYFLPKVTGREVHSYGMAVAGFWGIIGLGAWTGMSTLMGGPLPAWMPALSGGACLAFLIPALLIFLNQRLTAKGQHQLLELSPTLRFSVAANWGFLLFAVLTAASSVLFISRVAQFTQAQQGIFYAGLYGFFSMAMFAALTFITPRVAGCEWPSGKALRLQFWFTAYGAMVLIFTAFVGGLWQGYGAFNHEADWLVVVDGIQPYVRGRLFAFALLFAVNALFIRQLVLMVLSKGKAAGKPTLIYDAPAHPADAGSPNPGS